MISSQRVREYTQTEWRNVAGNPPMSEPFVIRGGCASWPAFQQLTPDYLRQRAGDVEVIVQRTHSPSSPQLMRLREFLAYTETSDEDDPLYLADWLYRDTIPEIRALIDPPKAFASWFDQLPLAIRPDWSWLYIGPKKSGSALHVDVRLSCAWNAVLSGCKEWLIFPPDHRFSKDLRQGIYPIVPLQYESGDAWGIVQHSGDLIYVPGSWSHSVLNHAPGIAITENFVNESNYQTVMRLAEESDDQEFRYKLEIVDMFCNVRRPPFP